MVRMAVVFVPNELLNFAVYVSKQLNASSIISIIGGFYHDDELACAKAELCKFYQSLSPTPVIDGWDKLVNKHGGPIKRPGGDSSQRRVAEADDIVQMLSLLTANKIALPCFVTVNLERIPPMTWRCGPMTSGAAADEVTDSSGALSSSIANLTASMDEVLLRLVAVEKRMTAPERHSGTTPVAAANRGISVPPALQPAVLLSSPVVAPTDSPPSPRASASWAAIVASSALPESRAAAKPVRQIVRGNRVFGCIKAVQRPLTCFVGRLEASTTEADLHSYLDSVGIHNAVCKKLSA